MNFYEFYGLNTIARYEMLGCKELHHCRMTSTPPPLSLQQLFQFFFKNLKLETLESLFFR